MSRTLSGFERRLQNTKGGKVKMGVGRQSMQEGSIGDLSVRKMATGLICYIKTNSGWFDINNLVPPTKLKWHNMILLNDWEAYSATATYSASYAKDANGFVHFRGAIKTDGSAGSGLQQVATLPKGFIPNKTIYVPVTITQSHATPVGTLRVYGMDQSDSDEGDIACSANLDTDGTMLSLDGVSFYAGEVITGQAGGAGGGAKGGSSAGGGGGGCAG